MALRNHQRRGHEPRRVGEEFPEERVVPVGPIREGNECGGVDVSWLFRGRHAAGERPSRGLTVAARLGPSRYARGEIGCRPRRNSDVEVD